MPKMSCILYSKHKKNIYPLLLCCTMYLNVFQHCLKSSLFTFCFLFCRYDFFPVPISRQMVFSPNTCWVTSCQWPFAEGVDSNFVWTPIFHKVLLPFFAVIIIIITTIIILINIIIRSIPIIIMTYHVCLSQHSLDVVTNYSSTANANINSQMQITFLDGAFVCPKNMC